MSLAIQPVGPADWAALATLFGPNGGYDGCWCMFWRLTNQEIAANGPAANEAALRAVVTSGAPVGLLATVDGEPVGWCAVAPRPGYRRLPRTIALKPDDPHDTSVWTVACFYIRRDHRRTGVATALLDAAVEYAAANGAATVEGHPIADPAGKKAAVLGSGTEEMFLRAGFVPDARPRVGRHVLVRRPAG